VNGDDGLEAGGRVVVVDDLLELTIHELESSHWMDLLEAPHQRDRRRSEKSRRGSPTGGLGPTYHRRFQEDGEVEVPFYLYFTAS
jgi:hypothetical protein